MAKAFDFNKVKPKTMTVTLSDEAKTTLLVMTPNKGLKDELVSLYENINDSDEDEISEALYDVSAKIMSRNKQGIVITVEKLKELYEDVETIMAFLEAYSAFVGELTTSKN